MRDSYCALDNDLNLYGASYGLTSELFPTVHAWWKQGYFASLAESSSLALLRPIWKQLLSRSLLILERISRFEYVF